MVRRRLAERPRGAGSTLLFLRSKTVVIQERVGEMHPTQFELLLWGHFSCREFGFKVAP